MAKHDPLRATRYLALSLSLWGCHQDPTLIHAVPSFQYELTPSSRAPIVPFCWTVNTQSQSVVFDHHCKDQTRTERCALQNHSQSRWDPRILETNPRRVAQSILREPSLQDCRFLVLDFEGLPQAKNPALLAWVREFGNELKKARAWRMAWAMESQRDSWRPFCETFDEIWIMAYDQHIPPWTGPGEIAGLLWVNGLLDRGLSQCPASQLRLGLAAHGYDWDRGTPIGTRATDPKNSWYPWIETPAKRTTKRILAERRGVRKFFLWAPGWER